MCDCSSRNRKERCCELWVSMKFSMMTLDKGLSKEDALKVGNRFFHEKKTNLKIFTGFVDKNLLFFGKKEGNVWVICRK